MIPASSDSRQVQTPKWQQSLANAVRDPHELLEILGLSDANTAIDSPFPLRVPRGYVAKMHREDPLDPLLLQVLPLRDEQRVTKGYLLDPVGDLQATDNPGLLHKYHGRALLITTGACAIHCRYCFRRHFPYSDHARGMGMWQGAIDQLSGDSSIKEIILSGGDPLTLSDARLGELIKRLESIPHLQRLRIHSRLPIVLPERITDTLVDTLKNSRFQTIMVIHANHARELDHEVGEALTKLHSAGCTLLNQSVLLRDVNDSKQSLIALSDALFSQGVLPYYLHLLDRVQGAAHFEVNEAHALDLIKQVSAELPGYLVPRLVREIPGNPNKTLIK